jgi:DNA-binding winged helix-turn-helix (wHTH) protein/TolB-like protein
MMDQAKPVYRFGPFRYDSGQRLLFHNDELVALAPKTAETLQALLEHRGSLVPKDELIKLVWPDTVVEETGLARNISLLRKALGEEGDVCEYVETIPKRGYRFIAEVTLLQIDGKPLGPAKPPAPLRWLRRSRWRIVAVVLAAAFTGFIYWQFYKPSAYLAQGKGFADIGVIPFDCMSPELNCGAFPRALDDLLVANLAKLEKVRVLSPSTVHSYQRARLSMWFMARLLGLQLLLEGTIQRVGDHVRITYQLVDVHTGKLVCSDSYEYSLADLPKAQVEAARSIAADVAAHLSRHGLPSDQLSPPSR